MARERWPQARDVVYRWSGQVHGLGRPRDGLMRILDLLDKLVEGKTLSAEQAGGTYVPCPSMMEPAEVGTLVLNAILQDERGLSLAVN